MTEIREHKEAVEKPQAQEQEKLEAHLQRVQRLESVGALASGVAHDLNNVLAPILVGMPFLKEQTTDPETIKILEAMEVSAARGAGIVKQILTFARGSAGEHTQIQPNQFIEEMVKILSETFSKSIRIRAECDPDLFEIEADPMQLHQVLLNLCVNARDAMPDGGTLTLVSRNVQLKDPISRAGLTGLPGDYVLIQVADTGVGMSPELQEKIFQPFFTTKEPGQGTGLGLSTTVGILQSHHALLCLDSAPGRGTIFSVYFPAKLRQRKSEVSSTPPQITPGKHELVLLVDDEVAIREMCKLILESLDYRVITAENGAEALSLLERHKNEISAAIVDMMMPVMDGPSVIRAIRWSAPNLKIIASSGLSSQEQSNAFNGVQPDVFLPKPYTAEQLMSALAGLLRPGQS
jgi:nitrogen-specific signal transduction histidine kinase/CheY-like chemotaxis protein